MTREQKRKLDYFKEKYKSVEELDHE